MPVTWRPTRRRSSWRWSPTTCRAGALGAGVVRLRAGRGALGVRQRARDARARGVHRGRGGGSPAAAGPGGGRGGDGGGHRRTRGQPVRRLAAVARARQPQRTRCAAARVSADILGSIAAIVAGAVVAFTGWTPVDPILSVVVALLILRSTVALLRESGGVLDGGRARAPVVRAGRPRARGAPRRHGRPTTCTSGRWAADGSRCPRTSCSRPGPPGRQRSPRRSGSSPRISASIT